jgi:hypothetical protein
MLAYFLCSWLTDGGKVVSVTRYLQEDFWYLILLEAEWTLVP